MAGFEITSNLDQFAERCLQAPEKLVTAVNAGLDDAAQRVQAKKSQLIARTYARPIPLRPRSGKPKWERSGDWRANQTTTTPEPMVRRIASTGHPSEPITNYPGGYEQKLGTLPVSADGVDRRNDAAGETYEGMKDQIPQIIANEVNNTLRDIL